jgi:ribosomal protein S18 acetylase RimI-like enzyme
MSDELTRAFAFMARGDMAGDSLMPSQFGTAVRSSRLPLRQDSNYLLVGATDASAEELRDELARVQGRVLIVRDGDSGARLAHDFSALGWQTQGQIVMAYRGGATRTADTSLVTEVGEATLRPLRRETILAAPWGSEALVEQLLDAKLVIAERLETHFLAVLDDGVVAAYADLYLDGDTGQVEDVQTVEAHRNRGFASALVVDAVRRAHEAGASFVFLVAHEDDWPRELYGRLGFETVGRYFKFFT